MNKRRAPIVPLRFHNSDLCLCAIASGSIHHLALTKSASITISATQIYHGSREFGRFTRHPPSCVSLGQGLVFKLLVELSVHPFGASVDQNSKVQARWFCVLDISALGFFLSSFVLMCSFEQFFLIFEVYIEYCLKKFRFLSNLAFRYIQVQIELTVIKMKSKIKTFKFSLFPF